MSFQSYDKKITNSKRKINFFLFPAVKEPEKILQDFNSQWNILGQMRYDCLMRLYDEIIWDESENLHSEI